MNYLENIGKNAKKAFENLKTIEHNKIKKVLENYNKSLLDNKKKIIKENHKDVKNVKRKGLAMPSVAFFANPNHTCPNPRYILHSANSVTSHKSVIMPFFL